MTLNPELLHPTVRAKGADSLDLTHAERTYVDTLQALADSLRSEGEMLEAASVLDPFLDARDRANPEARAHLDETAQWILKAARGARDARSGMGVELCLDDLRFGLGDAKRLVEEMEA